MLRSIIAAAGIVVISQVAVGQQGSGRDDSSFLWSKQVPAGATLTIRSGNGPIDVRESPNDRVEVRAVKRARGRQSPRDVTFDVREGTGNNETMVCVVYDDVSMCDDNRRSRNVNTNLRVDFTVLIPRSMRLHIATGNGEISIDKAGAEVYAATGNGRVNIGETTGSVDASTGNGDVQVESAMGPVRVSTGNGQIFVATSAGPVTATTGNGDVVARMRSLTSSAGMSFTTGSGSIRVTLPADYNGTIDASTGNGSLNSEFDISISGRLNPHHLRGTIGRGGPTLRLQSGNGNVMLRKG